jgi:cytochrome c oxidase assembly protein Cox11
MIGRMSRSSKIIVSLVLIPLIVGITLLLASVPIYKVILILLAIGATGYLAIGSVTQVQAYIPQVDRE